MYYFSGKILGAILFGVAILSGGKTSAQPTLKAVGNVSLIDEATRIVLAQVSQVSIPPQADGRQREVPFSVTYSVKTLCEYRNRVADGSSITVMGKHGVLGSAPVNIPLFEEGDVVLMALRATPGKDRFEFAGSIILPLGCDTPLVVEARDIIDLRTALLRLGRILFDNEGRLAHEDAVKLLKDKNRYLWAIGVNGLASSGTEEDAKVLLKYYDSIRPTVWHLLWLEHCFEYVFSSPHRPSVEVRFARLKQSLRSLEINRTVPKG